jgi:hypothetical protein
LARKGISRNGRDRLDEAMAMLIQNQAAFVAQHADLERRHLELRSEAVERFARIEAQIAQIIQVLTDHSRQLERLTEAVRDNIGFKAQT